MPASTQTSPGTTPPKPLATHADLRLVPRDQHPISRKDISPNALRVLYRLRDAGFSGYLVGGAVRDLLVGGHPKDFDVATSATPAEVRALFRNCRLIGRRFRLAHVVFGREIIEVATFRANTDDGSGDRELHEGGRLLRDNVYGSIEEDAIRRDFTANALYYAIEDFSVRDYTGGFEDVQNGLMRLIGDPETRYREDPVRMLRAARLAAKLGFEIEAGTAEPIPRLAPLLRESAQALRSNRSGALRRMLLEGLRNTDERVAADEPVSPAFLFALLLWPAYCRALMALQAQGVHTVEAQRRAADRVMVHQLSVVALPRRFSVPMQEIWLLQPRFSLRQRKRVHRLLAHPRFRAAYDFLVLRLAASDEHAADVEFWRELQTHPEAIEEALQAALADGGGPEGEGTEPRRRRRRRRRPPGSPAPSGE